MINELTKGIFKENPIFIIMLGLCPTLAVSTQVVNALGALGIEPRGPEVLLGQMRMALATLRAS